MRAEGEELDAVGGNEIRFNLPPVDWTSFMWMTELTLYPGLLLRCNSLCEDTLRTPTARPTSRLESDECGQSNRPPAPSCSADEQRWGETRLEQESEEQRKQ